MLALPTSRDNRRTEFWNGLIPEDHEMEGPFTLKAPEMKISWLAPTPARAAALRQQYLLLHNRYIAKHRRYIRHLKTVMAMIINRRRRRRACRM
jgi:hypothetical protein